jgi:hypothetical protein
MNSKHLNGSGSGVAKYASVSNGTALLNGAAINLSGVLNATTITNGAAPGHHSSSGANTTATNLNLMRSLINSSSKHSNTSGKHDAKSYLAANASNNSINLSNLNVNSANNIFTDHDLSTYSLLPSDSYKSSQTVRAREKTLFAAQNGNMSEKTTARGDSSKLLMDVNGPANGSSKNSYVNVRRDTASKENAPGYQLGSSSAVNIKDKLNYHYNNNNGNAMDTNSIISSFYGNNSTVSTSSHAPHHAPQKKIGSSNINGHSNNTNNSAANISSNNASLNGSNSRNVLSSKQLNSQNGNNNNSGSTSNGGHKKDDCLTSNGELLVRN